MEEKDMSHELLAEFSNFVRHRPHDELNCYGRGSMLALVYLHKMGGSVLPGQMAADMNLSSARVAAILRRMEEKELVTRMVSEDDRRKEPVVLTEKGEACCLEREAHMVEKTARLIAALGEQDTAELLRIIKRINRLMDGMEDMEC